MGLRTIANFCILAERNLIFETGRLSEQYMLPHVKFPNAFALFTILLFLDIYHSHNILQHRNLNHRHSRAAQFPIFPGFQHGALLPFHTEFVLLFCCLL